MTDKTEEQIRRGERAAQLMADELLNEALDTIKQEYMQKWLDSPERDVEGRERLRLMVKTVNRLRMELMVTMETGVIANATLAQRLGETLSRFY